MMKTRFIGATLTSASLCTVHALCVMAADSPAPSNRAAAAVCDQTLPPENLLTIWTARWCTPCRAFWADYSRDQQFREILHQHWQVRAIDVDLYPQLAADERITSVPTFDTRGRRITGYQGQEWLLHQLGMVRASTPDTSAEPAPFAGDQRGGDHLGATAPRSVDPLDAPSAEVPAAPQGFPPQSPAPDVIPAPAPPVRNLRPALWRRLWTAARETTPIVLTGLELAGVIGGTAATGGLGAVGLAILLRLLRRRRQRRPALAAPLESGSTIAGGSQSLARAPFPRELDEARQLVGLRQSEGRVAVLDALRGMFLDDEAGKLIESGDPQTSAIVQRLKAAIDTRVAEVAPLSTNYSDSS